MFYKTNFDKASGVTTLIICVSERSPSNITLVIINLTFNLELYFRKYETIFAFLSFLNPEIDKVVRFRFL